MKIPYHGGARIKLDVNYLQEAEDETTEDDGGVYYQFGDVRRGAKSLEFQHVLHSQHVVEHYLLGKLKCVKQYYLWLNVSLLIL